VAVNPDGSQVYVAGNSDDAVAVFSRNEATGALTFVETKKNGTDGVDGLEGAISVAVSPDGSHLYAAGNVDNAVAVFKNCYTSDLDCDGDVDIVDIMTVASRWNTGTGDPGYDSLYDLDKDGDIDVVDVMTVAVRWGWTE
jgi:DNA-binding beta-propeller fold protein YncE